MLNRISFNVIAVHCRTSATGLIRPSRAQGFTVFSPLSMKVEGKEAPTTTASSQHNYTQSETEKILDCVNKCGVDELLHYDISNSRAQNLANWKDANGRLQCLADLVRVRGFNQKAMDRFCTSILSAGEAANVSGAGSGKQQRARYASFVTPAIAPDQLHDIKSCVSVRVSVSSVTWSRLELPDGEATCLLTHWKYHSMNEKRLHLKDLVHHCLYLNQAIPKADCYIFESPRMVQAGGNPGNADQQNVNIQTAQINAILSYSLAARMREKCSETSVTASEQNVFYLRRFLTARLFKHLVGTERVSSEETVQQLMRVHYNVDDDNGMSESANLAASRGQIRFPQDLREMYARAEGYHREFLGQALLLNLAFVRLVVLQDAESIRRVSRSSNKNKDQMISM